LLQAQQYPPANAGALSAQAFRGYDTEDMKSGGVNAAPAPVATPPANSGALSAQDFRNFDTKDMISGAGKVTPVPVPVVQTPQTKPQKHFRMEDYQKQLDDLDAKIDIINGALDFGTGSALGTDADPTGYLHTLNTSLQTLKGMRQSVLDSIDACNKADMAYSESDDYVRSKLPRWIELATKINGYSKDERQEARDAIRVLQKRAGDHNSRIKPDNPDVADGCGMMLGDYLTMISHLENVANGGASAYYGYAGGMFQGSEDLQELATRMKNNLVADTVISNPQLKEAILDPSYDQVEAAKKANPGAYELGNLAAFATALWYGNELNGAEWYNLDKNTVEGYNGSDFNGNSIDGIDIINGKVGGKIPVEEFKKIRISSLKNPDGKLNTLTLGKYSEGPDSYITMAGNDSSYFDLGEQWGIIKQKYGLSNKEMFGYFNRPILDDAVSSGRTIRFSHKPTEYKGSFLAEEREYLKDKLRLNDENLIFEGGFWYVR
jgi:hypothetical protein